jgi:hypothetical protein
LPEPKFVPRLEHQYRATRWQRDIITCLICVSVNVILILTTFDGDQLLHKMYTDQHLETLNSLLQALYYGRAGFILCSALLCGWLLTVLSKPTPANFQKYDTRLLTWEILLIVMISYSNLTRPSWYTAETAIQIPGLFMLYLILPQHNVWFRILPPLAFTGFELILYTIYKTPPAPLHFGSIYNGLVMSNGIGIFFANQLYGNERNNFLLHRKKDRLVSLLLKKKKQLQQEKQLISHYQAELRRKEVRRERIKALQAQIKPHFLFNSLSTIAFYCRTKPDKAYQLVNNLGTFLQSTFTLQRQEILWGDELKLIHTYLNIEAARMEERLRFSIDETGDLSACRLPPFTVQPLVENAVRHGLATLPEGGTVKINVRELPENYYFEVQDNGCGFQPDRKPSARNARDPKSGGIGLANIEERLQALYGCGLQITSTLGEGTTVSFAIPKNK